MRSRIGVERYPAGVKWGIRMSRVPASRRACTAAMLLVSVALLLAACDEIIDPGSASGAVPIGQVHPQRNFQDADYDRDIAGTVELLNRYWTGDFPQVGGAAYQPIPNERVSAYYPGEVPGLPADCEVTAEMAPSNAMHCGGWVSWDESWLWEMYHAMGDFAPLMIIAHDWGHYVQATSEYPAEFDIRAELQADCLAGAFMRHAHLEAGILEDGDVQEGLLVFKAIANERPDDPWMAEGAHGTPEERAVAIATGFAYDEPVICEEYDAWERSLPVDLGTGLTVTLPRGASGQLVQPGYLRVDLSGRQLSTLVDVVHLTQHDPADPARVVADVIGSDAAILRQLTPYEYAGGQGLLIQYQQLLNGEPAHGELLIASAPNVPGLVAIDVREAGEGPSDFEDTSWRRINSVALLFVAGLELPAQ